MDAVRAEPRIVRLAKVAADMRAAGGGLAAGADHPQSVLAMAARRQAPAPGAELVGPAAVGAGAVSADRAIRAADPELEVRAVVREIRAAVDGGVDPTDVAVLYTAAEPYARLVWDRLEAAALPVVGPAPDRLAQSVPGQFVLAALGVVPASVLDGLPVAGGAVGDIAATVADQPFGTWAESAAWLGAVIERYLDAGALDTAGRRDLAAVGDAISGLRALDGAVPPPSPATLGATVRLALSLPDETGPGGPGVFAGPAGAGSAADWEVVAVVGLAEGWLAEEDRVALAHALGAARRSIVSCPAADPRAQRPVHPARWWIDASRGAEVAEIGSLGALLASGLPVTAEEALLVGLRDGDAPHPARLRRGLAALEARASARATAWDGIVGPRPGLLLDPGAVVSPTALQTWAECPRRYFLGHVLRVAEGARPDDTVDLHPLDYGSLVHDALEEFFRRRAEAGDVGGTWTDADVDELLTVVDERCRTVEALGITGLPIPWSLQRRDLLQRLRGLLARDAALRSPRGLAPVGFEVAFGGPEDEIGPVLFTTATRTVRFKGRVDRIDADADGRAVHVIDYKTGAARRYAVMDDDPVDAGRLLQLPVYALAAQRSYPEAEVTASYWFVTDVDAPDPVRVATLDAPTVARFAEVVDTIADGIEDGVFPGVPGTVTWAGGGETWAHCRRCPYDRVCPADRDEAWGRIAASDAVAPYRRLSASTEGAE